MDEKALDELAREELLRDSKRAAVRAEMVGALGWANPTKPKTNKRFLNTMMLNTVRSSSLITNKQSKNKTSSSSSYKNKNTQLESRKCSDHHSKKMKLQTAELPLESQKSSTKLALHNPNLSV
ncbi:protein POLR1D-like [Centruroides sculpturatus]|uniref:protein POLR1D-like n=1 Tax=Centruroides sculpturatus TaxID=218467 RepID=UPI000C6D2E93|nr:protein POLR1D-like [Centruroides sculpturatus]